MFKNYWQYLGGGGVGSVWGGGGRGKLSYLGGGGGGGLLLLRKCGHQTCMRNLCNSYVVPLSRSNVTVAAAP